MTEKSPVPFTEFEDAVNSRNDLIWSIQRFVCEGRNEVAKKLREALANEEWSDAAYLQVQLKAQRSIANEIQRQIEEFSKA